MKRSKRASMQLSINAIVILVMAMAVLGIGLGLIRGVLAPAQDNLQEAIDKVDLSEQATSTKPIANLPQTIRMKLNRANQLVVSYYNVGSVSQCTAGAQLNLDCGSGVTFDATSTQYLSVPADIGTATTLIGNVQPTSGSGTVPCTVQVTCGNGGVAESSAVFVDFSS